MSRLNDLSPSQAVVSGSDCVVPAIGELTARFTTWLDQRDGGEGAWLAFDRWVRDSLHQFLGARRVRCYRVTESDQQLASLTSEPDAALTAGLASQGLIDHVIAGGRRYVRRAPGNGELIERLAREWGSSGQGTGKPAGFAHAPDWLLPIRDKTRTCGLIIVGEVPEERRNDLPLLQAIGHLMGLFWRQVQQGLALAVARRTDQASGVLSRIDLASLADKVLHESVVEGEPTVLVALAVEGVRRLDDEGQWQLRDWLMRQIGLVMRRKLRSDDLVGRFSDDRFVGVLRRLDVSLGQLIARKLLEAVNAEVSRQPILHEMVNLRCGLAAGSDEGFEPLLSRAFHALGLARITEKDIVVAERAGPVAAGTTAEVKR